MQCASTMFWVHDPGPQGPLGPVKKTQLPNSVSSDQCSDKMDHRAQGAQPLTQHRGQGNLPVGGDLNLVTNDKKELNKQ